MNSAASGDIDEEYAKLKADFEANERDCRDAQENWRAAQQRYHDALAKKQSIVKMMGLLESRRSLMMKIKECEDEIGVLKGFFNARPKLILPKLLPDLSDVDPGSRDHLQAQADQIVDIFRRLTTPTQPLVHSLRIKEYIEQNYEIEHPQYWRARTHPREPERWWKNIYDKAIERMDLTLGLVVRRDKTGKKGMYALAEYYVKPVACDLKEIDLFQAKVNCEALKAMEVAEDVEALTKPLFEGK